MPTERSIRTISSGEQRFAAEHFCEDTSDTPYVDRIIVHFERQHDFGRAIPARRHVSVRKARAGQFSETNFPRRQEMTHSVMKPFASCSLDKADRARPKSQICHSFVSSETLIGGQFRTLRSQFALSSKFEGLRSRCKTLQPLSGKKSV